MDINKENICIITDVDDIYGYGHFSRMIYLAKRLNDGYNVIFVSFNKESALYKEAELSGFCTEEIDGISKINPYLIILDKRETEYKSVECLKKLAPIIIIDSIGEERELADVVIEMLPNTKNDNYVNIKPYIATILNTETKPKYESNSPILVYVGFNNSIKKKIISIISKIKTKDFILIDSCPDMAIDNVKIKKFSSDIFSTSYSGAITYYGLTAFECISNMIPTALISPTKYHDALAKNTSELFFDIGYFENIDDYSSKEKIENFFGDKSLQEKFINEGRNIDVNKSIERFKVIASNMKRFHSIECPICKSYKIKLKYRNVESNLYKCSKCKTLFRKYFLSPFIDYSSKYFEEDYKSQYGKTYGEDFENLSALARRRIEKIKKFKPRGKILDLGSAMGFFLKEARNDGYEVTGVEVSKYASDYCRNNLDIKVANISLMDFDYKENEYDIVTAWYVIEHIYDFEKLIDKIYLSLKKDGIFALAMPNGYGISGRLNKDYYSMVPSDHSFEANPKSIDFLLGSYGFKKCILENQSIYFERFLNATKIKLDPNVRFGRLYNKIAKKFNLGDTFECYYIKNEL